MTAYERRSEAIRLAAEAHRRNDIERTCARHELESDEFMSREEKAAAIIDRRQP